MSTRRATAKPKARSRGRKRGRRLGKSKRQPGALKGKLVVGPEFFEPLPPSEHLGFD